MKRSQALCGICAAVAGASFGSLGSARAADPPHWAYEGDDGPAAWGKLEPDFQTCSVGLQQSPIDLAGPVAARIGAITLAYRETPLRIVNNGHTIQVNYGAGSQLTVHGMEYEIVQFHFHTPSEHRVNGATFPLEMHIVHQDDKKDLAVLGVFFKEGAPNGALDVVWNAAPAKAGPELMIPNANVNVASLVPSTKVYYEYLGSLTTPPCTESVKWLVLAEPNTISAAQIAKFQSIFPHNARPLQPLNQRLFLENGV